MDLLKRIDSLIEKYKKDHRGEAPLYLVVSPDESAAVREEIRKRENAADIAVVSTYRNVKIAEHPATRPPMPTPNRVPRPVCPA